MSITVTKTDVLAFTITGADRLDPVRVVIENIEPGRGLLTVTCFGKSWNAGWGSMGDCTVQAFINRVSNDYLIGCMAPQLRASTDDDNEANLIFVKKEIIKLRRQQEVGWIEARNMWIEAENSDDVKESCCNFHLGRHLLNLFGDDPWYAAWPSVPNPDYQYLDRILNAVRVGLVEMERAA